MTVSGVGGGGRALSQIIDSISPRGGANPLAVKLPGLVSSSQTKRPSISDLSKHLDDYERGKGYLSRDVALSLGEVQERNSRLISPKSLTKYLSYSTAFTYSSNAFYTSGVDATIETVKRLEQGIAA